MRYATALTAEQHDAFANHLLRTDGQEDLCFALWRPSSGKERTAVLVHEVVLPYDGERNVHGNASFESEFFLRALAQAQASGAGLALVHSHPQGVGWQGLSKDDTNAERNHAAQALVVTGLPLVGLTMAGDGALSARIWNKTGERTFDAEWSENVRVVGGRLSVTYNASVRPPPIVSEKLVRTVSAWGARTQADLARLRIGVVGAGSVGALVAEALARIGVEHIRLIDFDSVKELNLDRLIHATRNDALRNRAKVAVLRDALLQSSTAEHPRIDALEWSVVEEEGFRAAIDCDVLFSCVDRPWARSALNLLAYAHLIPVVDGGILVTVNADETLRGADWKAHVAAPGRQCLECLEQYDPGLVSVERDGFLDDPNYIRGLPSDHPLKRNENVFPFGLSVASLEILQFLSMVVAPSGLADIGAFSYHFVAGQLDRNEAGCRTSCLYSSELLARGDHVDVEVTGLHNLAQAERSRRRRADRLLKSHIYRLLRRIGLRS